MFQKEREKVRVGDEEGEAPTSYKAPGIRHWYGHQRLQLLLMTVKRLRHGGTDCSVLGDKGIARSRVWKNTFRNDFFLIPVFLSSSLVLPRSSPWWIVHSCRTQDNWQCPNIFFSLPGSYYYCGFYNLLWNLVFSIGKCPVALVVVSPRAEVL